MSNSQIIIYGRQTGSVNDKIFITGLRTIRSLLAMYSQQMSHFAEWNGPFYSDPSSYRENMDQGLCKLHAEDSKLSDRKKMTSMRKRYFLVADITVPAQEDDHHAVPALNSQPTYTWKLRNAQHVHASS